MRQPICLRQTDTTFAIGWKGRYRLEGLAFVYSDRDTGRVTTILGYPTERLIETERSENFKYVWLALLDDAAHTLLTESFRGPCKLPSTASRKVSLPRIGDHGRRTCSR